MHGGTTIKIIDAQQAKLRNKYKNTKLNLLKTNNLIINLIIIFYVLINSAFVGGNSLYLSKCTVEQQLKFIFFLLDDFPGV
jgi:energy-converting hydrogenase Eha subunit G